MSIADHRTRFRWLLPPALAMLVVLGAVQTASTARGQATKPRIMPLGDSITHGHNVPGSYRIDLWTRLSGEGVAIDFVGSQRNGPAELGDKDHEGNRGWRIDQIRNSATHWMNTYQPDIVLLMIGTNDMVQNYQLSTAPDRLGSLLDTIWAARPATRIVVASIPPMRNATYDARARSYNAAIPNVVNGRRSQGRPVSYVDVYNALTPADLDPDNIHINREGYRKMASVWYPALKTSLGQVGSPTAPPTATRPGGSTRYLSDLAWLSMSNGWGPVERDRNVGGRAAGDGGPIRIGGQTYAKGLGMHAAAVVRYAIPSGCTIFRSDVGLDDSAGGNGSVVYQVWADGVKLHDSGVLRGSSPVHTIQVNISGKSELRLVVTNGGDTINYDHANWGDAQVRCTN